jgi:hypothetical protein
VSGLFAEIPTAAEYDADLREREADYTPRGVVRQVLRECLRFSTTTNGEGWRLHAGRGDGIRNLVTLTLEPKPLRVLDWCAGAGVWSSEMRAMCDEAGVPVHITAVELDERERPHLERWCDEVVIDDFARWVWPYAQTGHGAPLAFDLVIGNPAFSLLHAHIPDLLAIAPAVLVLHTIETTQRAKFGRALARHAPPTAQFDIGGSISFRGRGHGADLRSYCAWLWTRGHRGPGWHREVLPDLSAAERSWVYRPGAEP